MADPKKREELHKLCKLKNLQKLITFLENEQDKESLINMPSGVTGYTSLHQAVENKNWKGLQILMKNGGNVDVQAKGGYSPLHIAALLGHHTCILVLLKCAANITLLDDFGNSAHRLAKQARRYNTAKFLKTEELKLAVVKNQQEPEGFKALKSGSDYDEQFCVEALQTALRNDCNTSLVWLLADIEDYKNIILDSLLQGTTVKNTTVFFLLHWAISKSQLQVIKIVLCQDFVAEEYQHVKKLFETFFSQALKGNSSDQMIDDYREAAKSLTNNVKGSLVQFAVKKCAFDIVKVLLCNLFCDNEEKRASWQQLSLTETRSDWFLQIRSFENISLAKNKLYDFPKGLLKLEYLTKLDLSSNSINKLSKHIFNMPCLRWLILANNDLPSIPYVPIWSASLENLDLSDNRLSTIDNSIAESSLVQLNLARNRLTYVPDCIWNMDSLQGLTLSGNSSIYVLPPHLAKMKSLKYLGVTEMSQLTDPPVHQRNSTNEIKGYLMAKLRDSRPMNTIKLMIIGKEGSGKTTLRHRIENDFDFVESLPTEGVEISRIKMGKYRFNCWDVAGGDVCCDVSACFLTPGTLYLVVWNANEEDEGVNSLIPWLDNLQSWKPYSRILIVGTHLDRISEEKRNLGFAESMNAKVHELLKKYEKILRGKELIVTLSMKDGNASECKSNVRTLRSLIVEMALKVTADGSKDGPTAMEELLPNCFFSIPGLVRDRANELEEGLKLPALNKVEFEILLKENSKKYRLDYRDPDDLMNVTRLLHRLGVILHHEDLNSHLGDLYFINPASLFKFLVGIVSRREISNNVVLLLENLKHAFPNTTAYIKISPLLYRFQIVCPIDDHRVLVPSKLPWQSPVEFSSLGHPRATLSRIHAFSCIPHGFWLRLISRFLAFFNELLPTRSIEEEHEDMESRERLLEQPDISTLICKKQLVLWRRGFLSCQPDLYLSVVQRKGEYATDLIETKAMYQSGQSRIGARVFSLVVDHINTTASEWHKELSQNEELCQFVLCPLCLDCRISSPCRFHVNKCLQVTATGRNLVCKNNHGQPKGDARTICPDLYLMDLESEDWHFDAKCLSVEESEEGLLGFGTFAKVYRGVYRRSPVAVKLYNSNRGDPFHALKTFKEMRQEALMLTKGRRHPNIVQVYGWVHHPNPLLVMELSRHRSLRDAITGDCQIGRIVVYRIAQQISCALAYIHRLGIVHRDLKSDNVLVFSLESDSQVNVKLTDFGTANFISPVGLNLRKCSPGFGAPEMLCECGYGNKVDVFSFAMVLYELIAKRRPFHSHNKFVRDKNIVAGKRPLLDDISTLGFSTLIDLMKIAWTHEVIKRPTSQDVCRQLKSPGFCLLYGIIPLFGMSSVFQLNFIQGTEDVWISGFDTNKVVMIATHPSSCIIKKHLYLEESVLNEYLKYVNVITSIHAVGGGLLALHVQKKFDHVLLYSPRNGQIVACHRLEHTWISSMKVFPDLAILGFKDGSFMKLKPPDFSIVNSNVNDFVSVNKGVAVTAINRTEATGSNLLIGCGMHVYVYDLELTQVAEIEIPHQDVQTDTSVSQIEFSEPCNLVFVSCSLSPNINMFSMNAVECIRQINTLDEIGPRLHLNDQYSKSVTCFCTAHDTLWAGTGSGFILIYSINAEGQHAFLTAFQPYQLEVRSIVSLPKDDETSSSLIVTAGKKVNITAFCDKSSGLCLLTGALQTDVSEATLKGPRGQRPLEGGEIWPGNVVRCEDRGRNDPKRHARNVKKQGAKLLGSKARGDSARRNSEFESNLLLIWEAVPANVLKRILGKD